jgi:hypothetical protein
MDATKGREQSDLKQDNSRNHGDVVKFLWAHGNEKNQRSEIGKITA